MAAKAPVVSSSRHLGVASLSPIRISTINRSPILKRANTFLVEDCEPEDHDVRACATYRNGRRVTETAESHHILEDPAHIWSTMSSQISVRDYGGNVSLDRYMRLPVEQYFVLDPEIIKYLDGNRFELHVPRINLMNVWLDAVATVAVQQGTNPPSVKLKTESCQIHGSMIERLKLDKRFWMQFEATLTWKNGGTAAVDRLNANTQHSSYVARGPSTGAGIFGDTRLDVWCEMVPPFTLIPREILEGSCNIALRALMRGLLPLFLSKLRDDYHTWGRDAEYREYRSGSQWKVSSR